MRERAAAALVAADAICWLIIAVAHSTAVDCEQGRASAFSLSRCAASLYTEGEREREDMYARPTNVREQAQRGVAPESSLFLAITAFSKHTHTHEHTTVS